jgi:hypothetical protein|tara:strand:- start:1182 stop:1361 length:180 start_codon:yes stop_codon:yes gene_type:complete
MDNNTQSTKELLEEIHYMLTKDRILIRKQWVCRYLDRTEISKLIPKIEEKLDQLNSKEQ